ncbi:AAA family ATPase [Neobacillus vireti]|uniref:Magnesium chelatase, methanol dehydrogenase regulator n=1 Tax=Neobacillus vireti LMG 21834 TaxID=1131730 RepID=A0AB94IMC0_9BACI|nr:MoxR family ATPase [Neobacillus vireti]ETI68083.1 magnesium chelatase, methanol dehydrogenase regulator [Neobacillus vireti LMG 21834]KLT19353.1 magnesium chelatase [Neobacillus vireti]
MGFTEKIGQLKQEIGKVIVGKDLEVELMAISVLFNGHILLESVPGTGKTMLAKSFAAAIGGEFSRIQFTPDVLPSDVTGIQFFNPKVQEFVLRPGPIMANIVLADEINRATPRTQSSLLEVMEERQVTVDGITVPLEEPFMVIATQNPVESQQGTFSLPIAQMDRFFIKMKVGYPDYEDEKKIMQIHRGDKKIEAIAQIFSIQEIEQLKAAINGTQISADIEDYLLTIVRKTREHNSIELGVSPRGTLALMKAAQGKAFLNGRTYVTPDDVKTVAPFVLGHRIFLSIEGSLTKTAETIIEEILDSIPVPVESGANG